jgi:hypothetical protein
VIVTREADNPKGDDLGRIRRNAKRLLRDAVLLTQHGRHASAFALAVLGLEEIGKVILRLWGLSEYSSGHLHKQLAVSSLLIMDAMVREAQTGRGMVAPPSQRGLPSPAALPRPTRSLEHLERIAKAAMESEAGRFSQAVDAEAVDAMKRFAFYYDGVPYDAGFHPDQFTRVEVERIFKMCSRALSEIEDDPTVKMAKALFLAKREIRPTGRKGRSK